AASDWPKRRRMRNDQQFFSRPAVEAGGRRWDWAVLPLMLALLVVIAYGASQMARPYRLGDALPLSLDPAYLPYYLLPTTLRMFAALAASLRTVPAELHEAARVFQLSGWQRFWRLELPFAMPGLLWNMMMSMSGGWFFVVASEAISVADQSIKLPGIGSYIALAIEAKNLA